MHANQPKKYSCYDLKKIHTRNLMTKTNSCGSKIHQKKRVSFDPYYFLDFRLGNPNR